MAILSLENVKFTYPESSVSALQGIDLKIQKGDFIVLAGRSGSGKSTLLRLLKHEITPYGRLTGDILYKDGQLDSFDKERLAKEIGFVFQDPTHQQVMDSVLAELTFGMENLAYSVDMMHKRLAEMVHYFGLEHLLDRSTKDLSGGEKQLINLASVLLLEPDVLLLDEPFAQLDPIAAANFLHTLKQLNEDFGVTILIAEHALDVLLPIADRLVVLEKGEILHDGEVPSVVKELLQGNQLSEFLPVHVRLFHHFEKDVRVEVPITVNHTRKWLETKEIVTRPLEKVVADETALLQCKKLHFQYERHGEKFLCDLEWTIFKQEIVTIVGANGTGKSTLLKVLLGILKQQEGSFIMNGRKSKVVDTSLFGYLPQHPHVLFRYDTIGEEFNVLKEDYHIPAAELAELIGLFGLSSFLAIHPFDLSGGELQRAALLVTILQRPQVLVLDEPTKAIDPEMKQLLGELLCRLRADGMTIIMVTHDVEFAASYSTRIGLLFRGEIVALDHVKEFFTANNYYTTRMNRVTQRSKLPTVTTLEEAIDSWHIYE